MCRTPAALAASSEFLEETISAFVHVSESYCQSLGPQHIIFGNLDVASRASGRLIDFGQAPHWSLLPNELLNDG